MKTNTSPGFLVPSVIKSVFGRFIVLGIVAAALAASRAMATPTHEVVYSWMLGPVGLGNLIQATDGNFYGPGGGGASGAGTIVKMTPAGVITTLVNFTGGGGLTDGNGSSPNALILGNDGNFYGTTYGGGAYGDGTVFKMTPAGVLTTLVSFNTYDSTYPAANPLGKLVQGADGNFYGTTSSGIPDGTIFKVTPAGVLKTLATFPYLNTTVGWDPEAGLVLGKDGNFYGTNRQSGSAGSGTVFKMTPAGVVTTLVKFTNNGATNKGEWPGALIQGTDGNFYGTTQEGGTTGYGTIFKMTSAGVLKTLANLTYNGPNMPVRLIQGKDGNFYGVSEGGTDGSGTVFKMTPAGVVTTLVNFTDNGTTNRGWEPNALVQGSDGNFYGATQMGGASEKGTVFKMTPAGVLTTLVEFVPNGAVNGQDPNGLLVGKDGNFYGTTYEGGVFGQGTIFKMTSAGVLTTLQQFTVAQNPQTGLIQAIDGNFYGVTYFDGNNGAGIAFKMTPAGVLTKLIQFGSSVNGISNGYYPNGLIQGSDGSFYGTTDGGGTDDYGLVYKMTSAGAQTPLVSFTRSGATTGVSPQAALVQGKDGNFYGTTNVGGADYYGTIFKMTPAGVPTTLVEFTSNGTSNKGAYPLGKLIQGIDGNFYGTTSDTQTIGNGTVFKMTSTGVLTTLVKFTGNGTTNKGAYPVAELTQGSDGNFYGSTSEGGASDLGTLFKMTPAGALTTLVQFTGNGTASKGANPEAKLIQRADDGNFYGVTSAGGVGGGGTLFRLRFGPTPATLAATPIASTTATLQGRISPHGNATTVTFEYGTSATLAGAASVSAGSVAATVSSQNISLPVSGLAHGTRYYFRIVGKNIENTLPQKGKILYFTTLP